MSKERNGLENAFGIICRGVGMLCMSIVLAIALDDIQYIRNLKKRG